MYLLAERADQVLKLRAWKDWLRYVAIPATASATVVAGAAGVLTRKFFAPYAIGSASAVLLFAGIYAARDLTLWIVQNRDKL